MRVRVRVRVRVGLGLGLGLGLVANPNPNPDQLTSRPPRLELVTAACERAVAAVPPAWRCRDGSGVLPVCAAPLHLFVQELGSAVRAAGATRPSGGATGSGSLQERVAKLLDQLG